jgi:DNA gyrase subunit B
MYRFIQAKSEISTELKQMPVENGYPTTMISDVSEVEERINSVQNGSITSFQAIYIPADDLTDEAVKDKEILVNRFNMNFSEGKNKMDLVLTYTSNYSSTIVPYVNTGLTESGPHITQMKTVLTREFNKFFRDKKWLKDKDENLTGDDIQEGMYLVFNITAPNVSYDAQVKSRITKIETKMFLNALAEELHYWFNSNEKEIKLIADKALSARKAREAAKKARDLARGEKKKKEKALKFDSKLADCYSKNRLECEIYVTEGDSASGNLKSARDNEFQAVMPVRGKILNCQKSTLEKIAKNAEIMTMIDAFGLRRDPKTLKLTYDKDDLRYGKIIIAADADVDGAHIRNLFYTFIWNFCPQLIEEGYVYALMAPLYKITMGKDTYIYLKDDDALAEFTKNNQGKKYTVSRFKGLGEMNDEETELLVDKEQRTLCQVTVNDIPQTDLLFEHLMGTAVVPRKKFIQQYSKEATYQI